MPSPFVIKNRYEIRSILGRGGMGVVYQTFDTLMKRDVALKTLREVPDNVLVELFYRECTVLAGMVHPNVIEIFDMGEFSDENGVTRPFFVMPLLPGGTLHDLLYPAAVPIPLSRGIDMICQASRGLQAAHERGLLHRDIKPRNIFVMKDDSVKLIDFGVAHLMGTNSTGLRGTPQYMSPEQITFKPLRAQSDIFSMATVCYEALTAVYPFRRNAERRDSDSEIAEAITRYNPALASDINPAVNRNVAQVIAKGMAKEASNRFESAAAFAEALQLALRNEKFSPPNAAGVQIRISRARRNLEQHDYQFASEIIGELEAEGHSDAEIRQLRLELDEAIRKKETDRLIEAADRCFANEEFTLALRKIQELLQLDPANAPAIQLKRKIENLLTEQKVLELLRTAADHIEKSAFTTARQAVQDALKLRPNDTRARQLLREVDAKQKELLRQRQEQERLYQSAHAAWLSGKIEVALASLQELTNAARFSDPRERIAEYQEFYRRVLADHEALKAALEQSRALLKAGDFGGAERITGRYVRKYPEHEEFVQLVEQIAQARKSEEEAFRKSIADRLANEPNLEAQAGILEEAITSRPNETCFVDELRHVREKQKEVEGIVEKALGFEGQQNFERALGQWVRLAQVYRDYPGLEQQIERTSSAWAIQVARAKSKWMAEIIQALEQEDHEKSARLVSTAELELPGDEDLALLRLRTDELQARFSKVASYIEQAKGALADLRFDDARAALDEAAEASRGSEKLTRVVAVGFIEAGSAVVSSDWRFAKDLLEQAARLDEDVPVSQQLREQVRLQEREAEIAAVLERVTAYKNSGPLQQAKALVEQALATWGEDSRLRSRLHSIDEAIAEEQWKEERRNALAILTKLKAELETSGDPLKAAGFLERATDIASPFGSDAEFALLIAPITEQVSACSRASAALARDEPGECLETCDRMLERFPGHELFLNLKAQAELRESEKAADYLQAVDRQLRAEPDLAARSRILEKAVLAYPTEPYFQEELRLVKGQQELVRAIAERAQTFEQQEWFPEALERWQYLKTVDPVYPGLDDAIARITRLWEEKREGAKRQYIAQIERALETHDYSLALRQLKKAEADFPDDDVFSKLAQAAREASDRRLRAEKLLDSGLRSLESGEFHQGQQSLREAVELANDEPGIATAAADYLIRYAPEALRTDLDRAEAMISDARFADPAAELPPDLPLKIAKARRLREFRQCSDAVRVFEEQNNPNQALQCVRDFLAKYPGDEQAKILEKRLLDALEEAKKLEQRARDLVRLKALESEARTATHHENILDILRRAQQIARSNSFDPEVTVAADQLGKSLSAVAEIRRLMKEGSFEQADQLCGQSARIAPDYAGFQELSQQIEIAQRERAASYLREVEQKLARERDFNKQAAILEEAARIYPSESYYVEELNLVRNKQSFVEAEIARARDFESKELFEDALREWEALHSLYPWIPSCEGEIRRISQAWKIRNEELATNWARRIANVLAGGDHEAAAKLFEQAWMDLPGDPRLIEVKDALEELKRKQTIAAECFSRGKTLLRDGDAGEGFKSLQKAIRLVPADRKLRTATLELLAATLDGWLHQNWRNAEELIGELQATDSIPIEVSKAISSKKSAAELEKLLGQADEMSRTESWTDALRVIEAAASKFPDSPAVAERRAFLQTKLRQLELERLKVEALAELATVRSQLETTKKKARLVRLRAALEAGPLAHSGDEDVRRAATALLEDFEAKLRGFDSPRAKIPIGRWLWQAAALIGVLGAAIALWSHFSKRMENVQVAVSPDGVVVSADGHSCVTPGCDLQLPAGEHQVHLAKPGYVSQTVSLSVPEHRRQELRLVAKLLPLPPAVQIAGNVSGAVYLDGSKVGTFEAGQFTVQTISPGSHVMRIAGDEGGSSVPLVVSPTAGLSISGPLSTSGVSIVAMTHQADAYGLWTAGPSPEPEPVYLNQKNVGTTKNGYLSLGDLKEGAGEIQVGNGSNSLKFSLPADTRPLLYIFLAGGQNTGTLTVTTNVGNPQLFIDNKLYDSVGTSLKQRIVLPAKAYEVRAAHAGYIGSDSVRVSVNRGSETSISLQLTPKPALIQVKDALPGTIIKIDGDVKNFASAKAHSQEVAPGNHTIEISRDKFIPKRFQRRLEPGETVLISASDLIPLPVTPDPAAVEQQDWAAISTSRKLSDFQDFVRKHPTGPQADAANQKIEQLVWSAVDKQNTAAVRAFLTKYPRGPYTDQALQLLDRLEQSEKLKGEETDWSATDRSNQKSLEDFLAKHPTGSHSASAQQSLNDLRQKEAAAQLEEADTKAWNAVNQTDRQSLEDYIRKFPAGKHYKQAERALANPAQRAPVNSDAPAILNVLQRLANSWTQKDLEGILATQPGLNRRATKEQLQSVGSMRMSIRSLTAPQVDGDHATILCDREVDQTFSDGTHKVSSSKVTFSLVKSNGIWTIERVR